MNKKKIVIVANGLSNMGGIGNALLLMVENMYKLNKDFELDLMLFDEESAKLVKGLPCKIIALKRSEIINSPLKQLIKLVFTKKAPFRYLFDRILYKLHYRLPLINDISENININHNKYDIAIAYNVIPNYMVNYVVHHIDAKTKIGWAHSDISQKDVKKYGKGSSFVIRGLKKYKSVLSNIDKIYSVSQKVKDSLLSEIDSKLQITVFHNFTNKERIVEKSNEFNIDIDNNEKKVILLTVGRLSKEKGIDRLFKVAKRLKQNNYQYLWYLVGGPNKDVDSIEIIKKYNLIDNVVLVGAVTNPYPYFKMCDIYVHTSNVEGYCTTTNEARMLGKPVITTDVAGANEQVINGVNGYVVHKSVDGIYDAVTLLINDEELRKKFCEYNKNLPFDNKNSFLILKELMNL